MKRLFIIVSSAFFGGLICLAIAFAALFWWLEQPSSLAQEKIVIIEPRSSGERIAHQLAEVGVITYPQLFRVASVVTGSYRQFKAGEYAFVAGISPKEVAELLVSGKSVRHAITIPEGKTTSEILKILQSDDRLTGSISGDIAEGSLLPDTHYVHRGDTRQSVIDRMRRAHNETLAQLWQARALDVPLQTPQEALVLASIVEKETGEVAERARVAGVFVNRLRLGMPLQSDPTTIYAIERDAGKPMGRALLRKDWEYPSPYNTYYVKSLPPLPICHPGRAAIEAALNPESHDYLYFVATGTGGHYFAKTLSEHHRNEALYRAARQN